MGPHNAKYKAGIVRYISYNAYKSISILKYVIGRVGNEKWLIIAIFAILKANIPHIKQI